MSFDVPKPYARRAWTVPGSYRWRYLAPDELASEHARFLTWLRRWWPDRPDLVKPFESVSHFTAHTNVRAA